MSGHIYAQAVMDRTGLANMLFPWARAEAFCQEHNARMLSIRWTKISRIGPWLRQEPDKRYYWQELTNECYIGGAHKLYLKAVASRIEEPNAKALHIPCGTRPLVVVFRGMEGLFSPFLWAREHVVRRLRETVHPRLREQVMRKRPEPYLAVHVRRGDFCAPDSPEAKSRAKWNCQIVDGWYLRCIEQVRSVIGRSYPVIIFSDADPSELAAFHGLNSARFAPRAPAVVDLFGLADAKVLICSNSSFSLWAAFIGAMPSIWHPGPVQQHLSPREALATAAGDIPDDWLQQLRQASAMNLQSATHE